MSTIFSNIKNLPKMNKNTMAALIAKNVTLAITLTQRSLSESNATI